MKREMKSSIFKSIILCVTLIFFTSCSFFQNKKPEIATPKEVYTAIFLDDAYTLNKYFSEGFPINYRDSSGKTLLITILENNSLNSLSAILSRNVDTEQEDLDGKTPIFYVRSLEALKKMVEADANINVTLKDKTSLLTLFIKEKPDRYPLFLIDNGVDYSLEDNEGWNSIFWSVVSGDINIIKALKNNQGDFLSLDRKGNYPIYYAYDEKIISELLTIQGYDLKLTNSHGENVLGEVYLRAVANGYIDIAKKLIELGVNPQYMSYGDSALSIAKKLNNTEMIKFLNSYNIK